MRIEGGWFEWKEVYIPCKKALRFFAGFFSSCWLLLPRFYCGWRRAWIFGLFCTSEQMQAFETSYGGWSISAGPFVMQIQGGYFAPNAQLETVAKTAYSVESGMDLIAGACQWLVYFLAYLLFEQAQENPFTPKSSRYLRRIGALLCLGSVLPEFGRTILFRMLAGGLWSFFPSGLPVSSILAWLVLFAVSRIFDYGVCASARI